MRRGPAVIRAIATVVIGAVLVVGCGGSRTGPGTRPLVIEDGQEEGAIASGLEPGGTIISQQIDTESPYDLVLRADGAPPAEAVIYRLGAIDGFLVLEDYTSAETQANFLVDAYLTPEQQLVYETQRGRIALGFQDYPTAIEFLQGVRNSFALPDAQRAVALDALAQAQLGLRRKVDAVISLLKRDALLAPEQQPENQRRILDLIQSFDGLEQATLAQAATRNGFNPNLITGWFELVRIASLPDAEQQTALTNWRNSFPVHPAGEQLLGGNSQIALDNFNHIALLLPLTSRYGNAAKAFYDGFIDAQRQDRNVYKPTVSIHDVGEDPSLAGFYYRSAMTEGADFVVGPLGRDAVSAMLEAGAPPLPTLLIGDVEPEHQAPDLYGISLSPEPEARQVAERAFADGHRQAAIFRSATDWGIRASNAFVDAWTGLGGTIVANNSYPDTIEDYSRIIQRLFEINQSVARERVLSAQVGRNLSFTPRRRNDIDMLFFAGNARQARLLVPQLRFFQALDLPVYATSSIFTGDVNPAVDADLDGVVFGDMRWMVDLAYEQEANPQPDEVSQDTTVGEDSGDESAATIDPPARRIEVPKGPYSFSPLDRLYALGLESYYLVPRLAALRRDNFLRYNGQAFNASVSSDGNIVRRLDWATFDRGNIKILEPAPAILGD